MVIRRLLLAADRPGSLAPGIGLRVPPLLRLVVRQLRAAAGAVLPSARRRGSCRRVRDLARPSRQSIPVRAIRWKRGSREAVATVTTARSFPSSPIRRVSPRRANSSQFRLHRTNPFQRFDPSRCQQCMIVACRQRNSRDPGSVCNPPPNRNGFRRPPMDRTRAAPCPCHPRRGGSVR